MGRQAVILAGGRGTRLGEITRHTPKPLLQVNGQPFITLLMDELRRYGFDNIVLLVGNHGATFERAMANYPTPDMRVEMVPEPEPAGTAGALVHAADILKPRFLLLNGDSFFDFNILNLVTAKSAQPWIARIALRHLKNSGRYGAVQMTGRNITQFGEKSSLGPGLVNGGIYWLKREIINEIDAPPCSLETDILPNLASKNLLHGQVFEGNFIDIGVPADLERGRKVMADWRNRPAAFLDRDGVLNMDRGYVHNRKDFEWTAGAKRAIKLLNDRGYWVFVVTNQAGIARGYYDAADLDRLHRWMNADLRKIGAHIDRFYHCPHHPDISGECDCRKPNPGMLKQAMRDWPIDLPRSFMIGDKSTDMEAAKRSNVTGHLFSSGNLHDTVSRILGTPPV